MRSVGRESEDLGEAMSLSLSTRGDERRRRFLGRSPFSCIRPFSPLERTGDPQAPLKTLTARAKLRFKKGKECRSSGVIVAALLMRGRAGVRFAVAVCACTIHEWGRYASLPYGAVLCCY